MFFHSFVYLSHSVLSVKMDERFSTRTGRIEEYVPATPNILSFLTDEFYSITPTLMTLSDLESHLSLLNLLKFSILRAFTNRSSKAYVGHAFNRHSQTVERLKVTLT